MKNTKICLNAMVANESRTILRMLESCYQYIDYWVIQDNGSTDDTKEKIQTFFDEKGIPGFLYEIEWQYPGWNRDHTLQTCLKSDHGCDWILRMDADEQLKVDEDFDWTIFEDTSIASFNIQADASETRYFRTWLWNAKLPWFFQHDKRHETIHLPDIGEGFQRVNLPQGFRHIITNDGQTWFAPRKFLKDALELEIDKVVGDKVKEDLYHLWYIGKSYSDSYREVESFPFGKKHGDEFARRCIFYFTQFLNLTHNWESDFVAKYECESSYYAMMLIGDAYHFMGQNEKAKYYYWKCDKFSPRRNEHYIRLFHFLENTGKYEEALRVINKVLDENRKNPFPDLQFLIESSCYWDTSDYPKSLKERIKQKLNII